MFIVTNMTLVTSQYSNRSYREDSTYYSDCSHHSDGRFILSQSVSTRTLHPNLSVIVAFPIILLFSQ